MSEPKQPTDKQLIAKVKAASGDYYSVAAEIGWRPYKLHDRVVKATDDATLLGKVSVFREFGERLQRARKFQQENVKLRRELRAATDFANLGELITDALNRTEFPKRRKARKPSRSDDDVAVEWLFSDLHYGKHCEGYDVNTARGRVAHYADEVVEFNRQSRPTTTTVAFMGDLIESTLKHKDSSQGCSIGTAEQIVGAFRCVRDFLHAILPTAGEDINIIGVSGNHENPLGSGAMMSWQGANHLTYIIYSLLADEFASDERIDWVVPQGNYAALEGTIYEHGDDTQPTEKGMADQLMKRSRQVGELCRRYRQGDKHVAVVADGANLVCNGAFYSDRSGTEFSSVKGYFANPCQIGVFPNGMIKHIFF